MSKELFEDLLNQYIAGELSREDKMRLGKMIDLPEYEEALENFVREIMLSDAFAHIDNPQIKSDILSYVDRAIRGEKTVSRHPVFRLSSIGRYVAAAILILLFGASGYFIWQRSNKRRATAMVRPVIHDIAPGHAGAILTLSGGQQIVLDSMQDGKIGQQGKMEVVKTNGQVSYQAKEAGNEVFYNTMTTPRGRQYQLILPDGTHVWLNAASSITFPTTFTVADRRVTITGEAYLEVAQDKSRPFHVEVRNMDVAVLGTCFDINAYPDEEAARTTLLEGSVKVSLSGRSRRLLPGEQAKVGPDGTEQVVGGIDAEEVLAWKNGLFHFDKAGIQTVMRQLARWYDMDVSYEGGIPQGVFSGEIGRGLTLSQVLKVLTQARVHFRIEAGRHLVLSPG